MAVSAGAADITAEVTETGEKAVCSVTVRADSSKNLILIKNTKIKLDQFGYLRGIRGGVDTFADVKKYFDNENVYCVDADGAAVADTDFVGTGYKIQLIPSTEVVDEIEVVVAGDFNCDGSVSNVDVSMLLRHLMGRIEPSDVQILAANVNGDEYVNNRDALLIARSLVGKAELN